MNIVLSVGAFYFYTVDLQRDMHCYLSIRNNEFNNTIPSCTN